MPFEVRLWRGSLSLQFWLSSRSGFQLRDCAESASPRKVASQKAPDVLSIPGCVYCIQCPTGISRLWPGQARNLAWNTFSRLPAARAVAPRCAALTPPTERPEQRSWTLLGNMRSTFHNLRWDNTGSTAIKDGRRSALLLDVARDYGIRGARRKIQTTVAVLHL